MSDLHDGLLHAYRVLLMDRLNPHRELVGYLDRLQLLLLILE